MKRKSLVSLASAAAIALALTSCASNKDKEQRQEEERQQKMEESVDAQEMQEDESFFSDSEESNMYTYSQSSAKPEWADQIISLSDAEKVQRELNNRGHNVGPVDGLIGPKTQKGIQEFQESEELIVTGEINQETLDALGVDVSLKQAQQETPEEKSSK